jgi:hypothetical protein
MKGSNKVILQLDKLSELISDHDTLSDLSKFERALPVRRLLDLGINS